MPGSNPAAFAAEVGESDPVVAVGGRTKYDVGGVVSPQAREVTAPAGIVEHEPAEMTVRVGAGTEVGELEAALAARGQTVGLAHRPGATVGGVLAVGESGLTRLRHGPVRDVVLGIRYVGANGRLVKAGGATVKNVSGFDLCRLMVGSLGTLGLLAEVILRTRPVPPAAKWFSGRMSPTALGRALYRPSCLLWDGTITWTLLEGHPDDIDSQAASAGLDEVNGPPPLPPHPHSLRPADLPALAGSTETFLAEVGVGVVHRHVPPLTRTHEPAVHELNQRVKQLFDPTGRLAPGRSV